MTLKEKVADNIVSFAIALRTAQKMRLSMPEGPAKSTAREYEHITRKKLNEAVDLYLTLPGPDVAPVFVTPEKER